MTFECALRLSDDCVESDMFDPADETEAGEAVCCYCADVQG